MNARYQACRRRDGRFSWKRAHRFGFVRDISRYRALYRCARCHVTYTTVSSAAITMALKEFYPHESVQRLVYTTENPLLAPVERHRVVE